jgi:hypothetical protein
MSDVWSSSLLALVSLFCGGLITHALSRRRDLLNKKREIQFRYLIDAYRSLEKCAWPKAGHSDPDLMEPAIADIQLFGTADQVAMAHRVAIGMADSGEACITELLEKLRADLRRSLGLPKAGTKILHMRLKIDPERRAP